MDSYRSSPATMKSIHNLISKHREITYPSECMSPCGKLPVETLRKIFAHLPFDQRKKLRLVCPRWKSIVENETKFNAVLTNKTVPWLRNCSYNIETLLMRDISVDLPQERIYFLNLKNIIIGKGNSPESVIQLLTHYADKLTELTVQNLSLSHTQYASPTRAMTKLKWPNLGTLSIAIGTNNATHNKAHEYVQHVDTMIAFLKAVNIQTLRTLTVNLDYEGKAITSYLHHLKKPFIEIFTFIIKHKNTLEELNLTILGHPTPHWTIWRSRILFVEFPKLQLKKLSIKFDAVNTKLACAICLNVNKLQELRIHETYWSDGWSVREDAELSLNDVLKKHGRFLQVLEVRSVSFGFQAFVDLPKLRSLEVRTCYPSRIGEAQLPKISTLTKATFWILNAEYQNLTNVLTRCIETQLQNVEEVEIILFCKYLTFNKGHLEKFLRLPNISKLKLGQKFSSEFLELCDILGTQGLSYEGEQGELLRDNMDTYDYIVLKIDKNLLPIAYQTPIQTQTK